MPGMANSKTISFTFTTNFFSELEEGETPANDDELDNFEYSELPVKQECNSSAILTQLKLDLDCPGISLSDFQNEGIVRNR
jgi:hypothetical protein